MDESEEKKRRKPSESWRMMPADTSWCIALTMPCPQRWDYAVINRCILRLLSITCQGNVSDWQRKTSPKRAETRGQQEQVRCIWNNKCTRFQVEPAITRSEGPTLWLNPLPPHYHPFVEVLRLALLPHFQTIFHPAATWLQYWMAHVGVWFPSSTSWLTVTHWGEKGWVFF